jgi:hypothetical protein
VQARAIPLQGRRARDVPIWVLLSNGSRWVTGTMWPGLRGLKKFEREQNQQWLGYSHDIGMLFEAFPHDSKLCHVDEFIADAGAVIGSILECKVDVPVSVVEPVRYRPHVGCVFKLEAQIHGSSRTMFVKHYADEDVSAVSEKLRLLPDGMDFRLLRPLGWSEQKRIVIWPGLDGVSLADAIREGNFEDMAVAASQGLAEFHGADGPLHPSSPKADAQQQTKKAADFISIFMPELTEQLRDLARAIPDRFGSEPLGVFHHDMKPEHVLLDGSVAQLIDVEGIGFGDPLFDLGNMISRIEAMRYMDGLDANACIRAASFFGRKVGSGDQRKLMAAIALGKLKLAVYAISHLIQGWQAIAATEVRQASDLVLGSIRSPAETTGSRSVRLVHS